MVITSFDRQELKYLVDPEQRRRLLAGLRGRLLPDPHGDRLGRYPTVDLYFDNADLDGYWDRWRDLPSRRKLRLRVYGGARGTAEAASFLEVKHRLDGRVYKRRVRLPVARALAVCRGEAPPAGLGRAERLLVAEVQAMVRGQGQRPRLLLCCQRQAFVGRDAEADLRLTFDRRVGYRTRDLLPRAGDRDMDGWVLGNAPCVMEVKVGAAVPRWLADLVAACGCAPRSHSKYAAAVEAAGLLPSPGGGPRPLPGHPPPPARQRLEHAWTP